MSRAQIITQPINVTDFVSHGNVHFDEVVGMWLFFHAARETGRFAWGRRPNFAFMEGDDELGTEVGRLGTGATGVVCFGTGDEFSARLTVYDEHLPEGRIPNACTATLVAEDLDLVGETRWVDISVRGRDEPERMMYREIPSDPGFELVVNEALRCDTLPGVGYLQWAQIMKIWHRHGPNVDVFAEHNWHVTRATLEVLDALRARENDEAPTRQPERLSVPMRARDHLPQPKGDERKGKRVRQVIVPAYASARVLAQLYTVLRRGHFQWFWPQGTEPEVVVVFSQQHLDKVMQRCNDMIVIGIEGGQIPPEMTVSEVIEMFQPRSGNKKQRNIRPPEIEILWQEFARWEDGEAPDEVLPFELPSVVDALNAYGHRDLKAVEIWWAMVREIFDAYAAQSIEWRTILPEEYQQSAIELDVKGLRACLVHSDRMGMFPFARGRHTRRGDDVRKGNHLVLVRREDGGAFIGTDNEVAVVAQSVAAALIIVEALDTGRDGVSDAEIYRRIAGLGRICNNGRGQDLPGLAHWHFQRTGGNLLNGSPGHRVPPTKLTDGALAMALVAGMMLAQNMRENDIDDATVDTLASVFGEEVDATTVRNLLREVSRFSSGFVPVP